MRQKRKPWYHAPEILEQLLESGDLHDLDFSGLNLPQVRFSGSNLRRTNFSHANLSWADLYGADLYGAYLSGANLSGANLTRADLSGANLSWANLTRADLTRADLSGANLYRADLSGANLYRADLSGADLSGAYLSQANLSGAYLSGAYLSGANLSGTYLDPTNVIKPLPDDDFAGFDLDGDKVYGWRTRFSQHFGKTEYKPGECHEAPAFSTDLSSSCHPGIYFATEEWLTDSYGSEDRVRCYALRSEIVKAVDKYRAKRLWIVETEKEKG